MAGRVREPDEVQTALAYRAGGWGVSAISQKTGVSVATLERWFRDHKVKKGKITADAIEQAAAELKASVTADLKKEITSVIADDVAAFKLSRSALIQTLEQLMGDTALPPHARARGVVAVVTGLKLSSDMVAKTLQIHDQLPPQEEIPELIVTELTADEIREIRSAQLSEPTYDEVEPDEYSDDISVDDDTECDAEVVEEGGANDG